MTNSTELRGVNTVHCFKIIRYMFPLTKINPFVPNGTFLYPKKPSENHEVFKHFQGV